MRICIKVPPRPTPIERHAIQTQSGGGLPGGMDILRWFIKALEEIEEWGVIPLTNRITKDQTPGPSLFSIVRRSQPLLCCR